MKVRAKFLGANKSLGYITGEDYDLIIVGDRIEKLDGTGVCKYHTIHAFLLNWKIITQFRLGE